MTAESFRRLTTATPAEVLDLAATAGYPAVTLTPMLLSIPPGRAAWAAFVAEHLGPP